MSMASLLPGVPTAIPWVSAVSFPAPKKSSWVSNAHKEESSQGENRHRRLEGIEGH